MKQRKIAISLAVVGGIAAPFILGTYKENFAPEYVAKPMTAEEKERIAADFKKDDYCQGGSLPLVLCDFSRKRFERGEVLHLHSRMPKYLALNAAAMAAGFVVLFGLTFLLPAAASACRSVARRYWRWLNT
jgi:hypothetical protein